MSRVIVQVPMSKQLRDQAEAVASDLGFSSVQEVIRVILTKFTKRELTVKVSDQVVEDIDYLSPAAEETFREADEDIRTDKDIYKPENKKEFFEMLNS